jgi:hypothetical protein
MHIINSSVSLDLGITNGWTNNLDTDIIGALTRGSITPVSLVEARKGEIEAAISSTLEALADMNK